MKNMIIALIFLISFESYSSSHKEKKTRIFFSPSPASFESQESEMRAVFTKDCFSQIKETLEDNSHEVKVVAVKNIGELIESLKSEEGLDFLVFNFHGSPTQIEVGEDYLSKENIRRLDAVFNCLKISGTIILNSCSTGAETEDIAEGPIAKTISFVSQRKVIAPCYNISSPLQFCPNQKGQEWTQYNFTQRCPSRIFEPTGSECDSQINHYFSLKQTESLKLLQKRHKEDSSETINYILFSLKKKSLSEEDKIFFVSNLISLMNDLHNIKAMIHNENFFMSDFLTYLESEKFDSLKAGLLILFHFLRNNDLKQKLIENENLIFLLINLQFKNKYIRLSSVTLYLTATLASHNTFFECLSSLEYESQEKLLENILKTIKSSKETHDLMCATFILTKISEIQSLKEIIVKDKNSIEKLFKKNNSQLTEYVNLILDNIEGEINCAIHTCFFWRKLKI